MTDESVVEAVALEVFKGKKKGTTASRKTLWRFPHSKEIIVFEPLGTGQQLAILINYLRMKKFPLPEIGVLDRGDVLREVLITERLSLR